MLAPPQDGIEIDVERKRKEYEFELITRMLAMHELGHVFGLFPGTNKVDPTDDELKAAHCQNDCVMWWQVDLERYKKIVMHPFCQSCLAKLRQFFIE